MDNVIAGMVIGMVISWGIMFIWIAVTNPRYPKAKDVIRMHEKSMENWERIVTGKDK